MLRQSDERNTPAAEFARRFRLACDQSPHVPPKHDGRYVHIIDEYKSRTNDTLTTESVRKWHEGVAMPRPAKIAILAEILGCNAIWLQTGHGDSQAAMPKAVPSTPIKTTDKSLETCELPIIPIPLRSGLTVEMHGLPNDLTQSEAKKIANIILAYAIVD